MSTSGISTTGLVRPFDHFVLTRFNVRSRYYSGDPGDEWLRHRLALFVRYTVPSFSAQTVRNFRWLVLIDSESPQWFRDELAILGRGLFETVDIFGAFNASAAAQVVAARLTAPFVLTTRVDNDDAVSRDFIEEIQKAWSPLDQKRFINLVNGAQLSSGRVYRRPYTQNPFVTLSEPVTKAELATVFVRRHYEVDQHAPVINLGSDHPLWLQVVHGGNVLTELVGLRMPAKAAAPWFGCDLGADDRPLEFAVDMLLGSARIGLRLVRKPRRFLELGRVIVARPARLR
jgi:hypothetical protein